MPLTENLKNGYKVVKEFDNTYQYTAIST